MKLDLDKVIIWSDASLLVVNKLAGLLSLPDGYDAGAPHLAGVLSPEYGPLWIVHRLDRQTSGVIVLARTVEAHRDLNRQFESRQISKVYHALVVGGPKWDERTVKLPLRANGDRRHRTVVDPRNGKSALSRFRVLERLERYTLIEAIPGTGRTHQIRVHLAAQGIPVVVDQLYGDGAGVYLSQIKLDYRRSASKPERPLLSRLGLHAWTLTLEHPVTQAALCFEAPYPKDFASVLRQLRRYCT